MAAAYKKKRSLPRDFIPLIFGKEQIQINLSDCILVHEELEHDPRPISHIISHGEIMFELLTNFDLYATRMTRFFHLLNKHLANSSTSGKRRGAVNLADELIDKLLVPFLSEAFARFHLEQSFLDLLSHILDFCLPYNPRSLERLARKIVEHPSLLGALISGKKTGGIIKQLTGVFKTAGFSYQTIKEWIKVVIQKCDSCPANHGVEHYRNRWHSLEDLLSRLRNALENHSQQNPGGLRKPMDLEMDVYDSLNKFGVGTPNSVNGLEMAISKLENGESCVLLRALVESFPCRPCYELSMNPSNIVENDRDDKDIWGRLGFTSFTELLGEGVGMWNILISAQALEDMQQVYTEGSFGLVESVIVRLASGEWERFSLRRSVGGKDSILYLAFYGEDETHGVLWQLDTEFDEKHDSLLQLIKVWRIGEIQVIVQAVPHIRLIHKTYSQERLDACTRLAVYEGNRVNYPLSFGQEFNDRPGTLELDERSQKRLAQSLMQFNKFYTVTKLTLKNISAQNLTAEYPLSLAKEELDIVKDTEVSTLIQGRSGTGKTTCLVYKMFGRYLASKGSESTSPPRQVLLTRSHILSSKLESYTKNLLAAHNDEPNPTRVVGGGSPDDREVRDTVFTIDSFPLVCTFSYFIKLLENTLSEADRKGFSVRPHVSAFNGRAGFSSGNSDRRGLYRRNQLVDFEVFSEQYWPFFPQGLKRKISATLAFMEIIGVIKGSACFTVDFRPLTRLEYITEGYKMSSICVDTDHMYDLYELYERNKRNHGDIDDIDRARNVLEGMSKNPDVRARIARAFDEIYVDEVQDQRLLELMMLLHLIKTPNAIHFAGDTAQSISKDSVFRFNSVQDILFARFSSGYNTRPKLCKLNKNYRTHQGILNVATSVMNLLYQNFKSMVDPMKAEEGQFSGPKPAVFVGFDSSVFSGSMFGATSLETEHAQLGADQVIIVRDPEQKRELQREIGDFALILTILESKGMEFEDVLVYDFFTTSPCISAFYSVQLSNFDPNKYIALCSELKQLYVAITRAQNRLLFFESNGAHLEPILRLWGKDVDTFRPDDRQTKEKLMQLRPGSNANPEIWTARGYQFIEGKNYDTALVCFRRAKDARGTTFTKALISEKMAKSYLVRGREQSSERYFKEAANFFHECGEALREAACYEALGDFERAAGIFSKHEEFLRAADLYTQINFFVEAATNFALAGRYNDGASVLAKGNRFDTLVWYLNEHITRLDPAHQRHYSRLCNLLLKRGKISPGLKLLAMSFLRTDAEKEDFFREYEMIDELSSFLIERERYLEACSLAIEHGDLDKAWDLSELYGRHMVQLPQRDRIEIYNCRQAKILHKNLSPDPTELFVPDPSWEPRCQWLSDNASVVKFWINLPQELEDFRRLRITQKSIVFSESWMRDIFNTIVTLKAHVFIDPAESLEQLPMESINKAINLAKELIIDHSIPVSFLTLLRILPSQKRTGSFLVLASSPLLANSSIKAGHQDTAILVDEIAKWTVSSLCQAVDEIQEKADAIFYRTEPCIRFQYKGFCHTSTPPCKFSHRQLEQEGYKTVINDLLRINSIFCQLLPLYFWQQFNDLAPAIFLKEFRRYQRRWLERLLARLIYVSSVEQSSEIIMRARNEIGRVKSAHFGVHGALDSLLFHKLGRGQDLGGMCEVSSLLEQLQIAQSLGARSSFERCLDRRVQNHSRAQKTWNTLQTIAASLKSGICKESVEALDKVVQATDCLDIQAFHAVITLYEKWAAHLIYNSNPGDVVLPDSWVQMYNELLEIVEPTDLESKNRNRDSLLSLTGSFCSLVEMVDKAQELPHKLSGKIRTRNGIKIFTRRNVHFLTTCVLNTYSWRTAPGTELHLKCAHTRAHVDKVLVLPTAFAPDLRACSSYYSLGQRYLASFKIYQGKDYPRIVKATDTRATFFSHLETSFPKLCLVDWKSAAAKKHANLDEDTPAREDHPRQDYAHMEPAVLVIQKAWKSRYPLILKRREFFGSPTGRAISYIQRVCRVVIDTPLFDRTEKLRFRSLLFSDGLKYHMFAEKVGKMFTDSRDQAKRVLANADIKHIESVQVKWEKLLEIQDRVVDGTGLLREGNWDELQTTPKELEERIRVEHNKLRRIEFNLRLLNERERLPAAAEAIQRIWRSRRPILNTRRKFGETEAGKTIAYVHRIVKALNAREELLDRRGKIRRATVLFDQVVQLIHEVKRIEKIYQKVNQVIRSSEKVLAGQRNEFSQIHKAELAEIKDQVRKNVSFLMEANWMRLNVPAYEIEENCAEAWRVMRGVECSLSRMISQRSSWA